MCMSLLQHCVKALLSLCMVKVNDMDSRCQLDFDLCKVHLIM